MDLDRGIDRRAAARRAACLLATTLATLPAATALADDAPVAVVRFSCVTKGAEDLSRPGGGPGGAHWNPTDVRCEAEVAWGREPPAGARLDLRFGQGRAPGLSGRAYLVPAGRQDAAAEKDPGPVATFLIPAALVASTLRRSHRQPGTGAVVFAARWFLEVVPLDVRGRAGRPVTREVRAELAFGE